MRQWLVQASVAGLVLAVGVVVIIGRAAAVLLGRVDERMGGLDVECTA